MNRSLCVSSYSRRDLRTADMLAIILFGLGLFVAGLVLLQALDACREVPRLTAGRLGPALPWIFGGGLLLLGGALNLKVRQLARNGGREPAEYGSGPQ
jgi:hypothetical protein